MNYLALIGHSPLAHAALIGALSAGGIDFQAFRSWKSFHDAEQYNWSVALFRWLQGAGLGLITALGIGGLL
jgi:hypothetical protein